MKAGKVILAILTGALLGAVLEFINLVVWRFLLPPFILLPTMMLIAVGISLFIPTRFIVTALIAIILALVNVVTALFFLGASTMVLMAGPVLIFLVGCIYLASKKVRKEAASKDYDIEHLPGCVREYIESVIRNMRYRRKVRSEVREELAGHFEDALHECKDEHEKRKVAERLTGEFGDEKLLATLIRRGKKRCRPFWVKMIAKSFQALGLTVLLLIVYIVWFFSGKPNITIDYVAQMNRAARPVADDTLNAAPFYNKAAELFEESYEKFHEEHPELLSMFYDEATGQQKKALTKWIADNKDTLELVAAGAAKPYYWQKYEGQEALSILLPNLNEFKNLTRTFCWRAWLRAEQGLYKDAFDDLMACYCLGKHCKGDKTLIEQLVGMSVESLTLKTLREILDAYEFDYKALTTLQEDWEELILQEDFAVSIKVAKFFMYDEIQRCFTDDRIGGGHLSANK